MSEQEMYEIKEGNGDTYFDWVAYFIPHYLNGLKSVNYGMYATLQFLVYSHAMSE